MKAVVTGGAGFIGSHLSERLLADGCEVVVIDNLSTGSMSNIQGLIDKDKFKFIHGDVCDKAVVEKVVKDCDVVYHLAAAVGVKLIADRPVHTIETNIWGTEVVLDLVNEYSKKIFLASTSEIYGKSEKVPFTEDDDLVLGSTRFSRWSYACSKAIDEFLGLAFHQQFGLAVVIGRFFNTIGPRQSGQYGMVVPRFVQSALEGKPLQIYGTGKQSRCFCYVGDVVDAVVSLMAADAAYGQVFNIGSLQEITIERLADKIIEKTGSKSSKQYISYENAYGKAIDDMMRRVPGIEKINQSIGWRPATDLGRTLDLIIKAALDS